MVVHRWHWIRKCSYSLPGEKVFLKSDGRVARQLGCSDPTNPTKGRRGSLLEPFTLIFGNLVRYRRRPEKQGWPRTLFARWRPLDRAHCSQSVLTNEQGANTPGEHFFGLSSRTYLNLPENKGSTFKKVAAKAERRRRGAS